MTCEDNDFRESNARLLSAIMIAVQSEIERVVQAVIDELSAQNAIGIVDDVAARHLWDEYCWLLQNEEIDPINNKFSDHIRAFIEMEVEKLPNHSQVFITAYAYERGIDHMNAMPGAIDADAMIVLIEENIQERTARRDLDLIGHYRADALQMNTTPSGVVCAALSNADRLWDILGEHVDELVAGGSDGEIIKIGEKLLEEYLDLISIEAADCHLILEFLDGFKDSVHVMLLEKDIIPAIEHLVAEIQELLDS